MASANRAILLLAISSYWQVVSGYVDVFSHRFVFKRVDPALNPAHISLYSAAFLGFFAVYAALKIRDEDDAKKLIRPGVLVAAVGAVGELIAGAANEVYHRVFVGAQIDAPPHFAIHGLFVLSMFVMAVGGILSVVLLRSSANPEVEQSYSTPSLAILVSAVWLIVIGSVSYLGGTLAGDSGGVTYLVFGAFLVSALALSAFLFTERIGMVTVAVFSFYAVNAIILYAFTLNQFLLPVPFLAAMVGEVASAVLRRLETLPFTLLAGAVFGALSYWLLYPYSYSFFGFSNAPSLLYTAGILYVAISGVLGGLAAFAINRGVANVLNSRFSD